MKRIIADTTVAIINWFEKKVKATSQVMFPKLKM